MMKYIFTKAVVAASIAAVTPAMAQAAGWPERPVKIIAPFPAGGFTDVVTRLIGAQLGKELGQPVIVENRPGAGTNIGTEAVAQSNADGYTLLMGTSSLSINRSLYKKLSFDVDKDLIPIGIFATTGYTLIASPTLPANDISSLISLAKAKPDSIYFGSSGNGAVNHLAGVTFASRTGTKLLHVPYKGSQAAMTDLIGGQIQLFWASNLEAMPMLKAGRVKALGVTTTGPVPALGNVPPISKTVKNYEVIYWMGMFAPARTPQAAVQKLSATLQKVSSSEVVLRRLREAGAEGKYLDPDASTEFLKGDTEKWRAIVQQSGATVD